jgi:DNA-binding CsgD family transcriptional regulator
MLWLSPPEFQIGPPGLLPSNIVRPVTLTPNERRILARLVEGKRTPAIAAELGVSVHTVRTVCKSIREKYGLRRMRDVVAEFRRQEEAG